METRMDKGFREIKIRKLFLTQEDEGEEDDSFNKMFHVVLNQVGKFFLL